MQKTRGATEPIVLCKSILRGLLQPILEGTTDAALANILQVEKNVSHRCLHPSCVVQHVAMVWGEFEEDN